MVREQPQEVASAMCFRSIRFTALAGAAVGPKPAVAGSGFADASPDKAPEIVAENDEGDWHAIVLFPNAWGCRCSPACSRDNASIMIPQGGKLPRC